MNGWMEISLNEKYWVKNGDGNGVSCLHKMIKELVFQNNHHTINVGKNGLVMALMVNGSC